MNEKSWELAGLAGAGLIWLSTMSYKLTKLGCWKDLSKILKFLQRQTGTLHNLARLTNVFVI